MSDSPRTRNPEPETQNPTPTLIPDPCSLIPLRIDRLVYGGDGIGRDANGRTVFVPGVAAGERVTVEIVEEKPNFARARLVEVIESSLARRDAPCPHFGVCGGCQLQYLDYAEQARVKAEFVREALTRVGRIAWETPIPIVTADEWGYRNRVQFKFAPDGDRTKVGFYIAGSNELREVAACPLLAPPLDTALKKLKTDARPFQAKTLDLACGDEGAAVASDDRFGLPVGAVSRRIGDFTYRHDAKCFFQVNRFLAEALVKEAVPDDLAGGRVAVDLYAGVGLFTLPLARRFGTVHAVEEAPSSGKFALENLAANGVENVKYVGRSCERWLREAGLKLAGKVDFLLVDPPRAGLTNTVRAGVAELKPGRLTYVSCDPTTLARDAKFFIEKGYRLESVVALDLFPQTFHVETVAKFSLN